MTLYQTNCAIFLLSAACEYTGSRPLGNNYFQLFFGVDYGVRIADGPLAGLLARAVLVLDEHDRIVYAQLVPDIAQEPDYAAVMQVVRGGSATG